MATASPSSSLCASKLTTLLTCTSMRNEQSSTAARAPGRLDTLAHRCQTNSPATTPLQRHPRKGAKSLAALPPAFSSCLSWTWTTLRSARNACEPEASVPDRGLFLARRLEDLAPPWYEMYVCAEAFLEICIGCSLVLLSSRHRE